MMENQRKTIALVQDLLNETFESKQKIFALNPSILEIKERLNDEFHVNLLQISPLNQNVLLILL